MPDDTDPANDDLFAGPPPLTPEEEREARELMAFYERHPEALSRWEDPVAVKAVDAPAPE